jgi:hypothetical protein
MEVGRQATTRLDVQLRGSPLLIDSLSARPPLAHFDLALAHEGVQSVRSSTARLDLPPGVQVERITPATIEVYLTRRDR